MSANMMMSLCAYPVDQQDGVEPDPDDGLDRVAPHALRAPPREPDQAQAGDGGDDLDRPHRDGHRQERERVRAEREQRPVRAAHVPPGHEGVDRVVREQERTVQVRVRAVPRAQPRVADVAEDVLRDERRRDRVQHVERHDRGYHPARADRRSPRERACPEDEHQPDDEDRLLRGQRLRHEAMQRPREPAREFATPGRDDERHAGGSGHAQQQAERSDADDRAVAQRLAHAPPDGGGRRRAGDHGCAVHRLPAG
jgi:hypothetical protein